MVFATWRYIQRSLASSPPLIGIISIIRAATVQCTDYLRGCVAVMHWLLYVGIALVIVIFILLGVLAHAGYFYTLLIRTVIPLSVPKRVAYKVYRGPYHNNSGFKELQKVAPTATTFGIYYDDPKEVRLLILIFILALWWHLLLVDSLFPCSSGAMNFLDH